VNGGTWLRPADAAALGEADALGALAAARVALLGERHDDAGDHLWQAAVIGAIAERAGPVAVGFEMFPRRAQPALDGWVGGRLDFGGLLAETRWAEVWGFDPELYRPLFDLCRARGLPMLALNVDRPVVSLVGRDGWGALPEAERGWLTPAAPADPAYRRWLFAVTGGARPGRAAQAPEDPAFDRFVRAQQVWDRAFACAIAGHLAAEPSVRVAAVLGRGHLEHGWGTPAQLADLGVAGVTVALRDDAPRIGDRPPVADLVWTGAARGG
jgi:uncharacterized iron-regulated protein